MTSRFNFILLIIFFYLFSTNYSQANIQEKLLEKYKTINTLHFDFTQNIGDKVEFGDCYIKYPLLMKCYYPKKKKSIITNGKKFAIIMPYKHFYEECIKQRYDVELLQNTFAVSFEQVAHRITCLQDQKMKGIPFHMLRADVAGNISKRFSLSGIEIPRYGGACPRWNIYKAFTMPGKINAAVSKMSNGEKYVCIARTVEKGIGKHGMEKTLLSIGLGCQVKYAKGFVYADSLNLNDKKTETPIGVNCRTCDRMDCQQRAFPPLHKKFDIDLNKRGISVYVAD